MSRAFWCTAIVGLLLPNIATATDPCCVPRMPCLKKKICCLKQKICDLTPRCVQAPIYRPCCRPTAATCCQQTHQTCCQKTCCEKKKECEIERVVINMQPARIAPRMQMQTVMVPQQRIVMVPQVQTFFTPQTVVGTAAFGTTSVGTFNVNGGSSVDEATVRAIMQRLQANQNSQGGGASVQARAANGERTLKQVDADLQALSKRVDRIQAALQEAGTLK